MLSARNTWNYDPLFFDQEERPVFLDSGIPTEAWVKIQLLSMTTFG